MTDPTHPAQPAPEAAKAACRDPGFFRGLTAQEHAAIHLRVPNSGTPWLDAMIRERMRDDLAQAAMQALIETPLEDWPDPDEPATGDRFVSVEAYAQADRMLHARGSKP